MASEHSLDGALDDVTKRLQGLQAPGQAAPGEADQPAQQAAGPPQKLVVVPVGRRSSRAAAGAAAATLPLEATAGPVGFRQVQLPATPPPGEAVQPTPAEKAPRPTPGAEPPANTPLAVEVLAGFGLGFLATTAAEVSANDTPEAPPAPRQHSSSSAGSMPMENLDGGAAPARRPAAAAAAAAAALAAAGPVVRPKAADGGRKGCNCKRSMCLKMYCECFAAGGYCAPGCACANCRNHADEAAVVQQARAVVLAKDPQAFEKKVTAAEGHKKGCRCKRSKCLKKYCECFHAGAKCNPDVCQCEGCRNTDGTDVQGAAFINSTSVSPDTEGLVQQGPAALLHALAGIMPGQLLGQDGPEASLAGRADSSDSLAAAGRAGSRRGGKAAGRVAQRQATAARGAAAAVPHMAFGGFPVPGMQAATAGGAAAGGLPPAAPFFLAPTAPVMPGACAGLFPGMPPFLFNPMAAAFAAAAAAGQASLAALQQPMLLPIAPLQPGAAPLAAAGGLAPEGEAASTGEVELSLLAGSTAAAGEPVVSLGEHDGVVEHTSAEQPAPGAGTAAGSADGGIGAGLAPQVAAGAGSTPGVVGQGPQQGSVALTAHLSEVLCSTLDPDIRDDATSPAPHVAVSRLPAAKPATLTVRGGRALRAAATAEHMAAAAGSRAGSEEPSAGSTLVSQNGGGAGSTVTHGADSGQGRKRPRRAASGGVMGAVAAEVAAWGDEWASPPKRASSVPASGVSHRAKAAGRFALLKKALETETLHAQKRARACAPAPNDCGADVAAEEEDAISALFELSSSVC